MNPKELEQRLLDAGCNPNNFAIAGAGQRPVDNAWVLYEEDDEWRIGYTERGRVDEPIFRSRDADEAAEAFYAKLTAEQHWHCVGFFKREAAAKELSRHLKRLGVKPVRNDIPAYSGPADPRFRVFVIGKDILKVRETFAELPVRDEGG